MKKLILAIMIFTLNSCKPQNKEKIIIETINKSKMETKNTYNQLVTNQFETFDEIRFNKNKDELGNFMHKLNNGTKVLEFGNKETGYQQLSNPLNSFFIIKKIFYFNGNIEAKGLSFINETGEFGLWYEFDEEGKLIKTSDYDKPFKISFADIETFCKKNKAIPEKTYIYHKLDEKTKIRTWIIEYYGEYKNIAGKYEVIIDDETGELEKVMSVTGRNERTKKEIIYEK